MPKEGYESVTLSSETVTEIDSLVDKKALAFKSRSEVIKKAIALLHSHSES